MFFYLEWYDKRPFQLTIIKEKPNKISFIKSFRIDKEEHFICANITSEFHNYYPPNKLRYTKPHYLSSHLQKCIRRMDDIKSVKTAKHFFDVDQNAFLRRLPIIMLEDVTIHESFPILIWLMVAKSKGFTFKIEMLKWLLGVVLHLSTCNEKTHYLNNEINEQSVTQNDSIFLQTLRIRKRYGGMKGDMNMIEYYTQLISNNKVKINNNRIVTIKLNMEPLHRNEWIYQANDFHCNRYIIQKIKKVCNGYSEAYIKELIWKFSSSINHRILNEDNKKQKEDWNKISKIVKKIQKSCIYY
tara:strand:- start:2486 stop:3382 length:897 start_codon:yes stop_codon:yes gene_type:complete